MMKWASVTNSNQDVVTLDIEGPAHGGHCVARLDGRVVFVRHALPGEKVLATLTQAGEKDSSWRADALDVVTPSPDRVASVWPAAGVGGVGGGELAHVSLDGQLRWKSAVIREQFQRLAGVDVEVSVGRLPGDVDRGGLRYRTRIELVTDRRGRPGMFGHRSKRVHVLDDMPLGVPELDELKVFTRKLPPRVHLKAIAPSDDKPLLLVGGEPWRASGADRRPSARRNVRERVGESSFKVAGDGFWQVHREAPGVLSERVVSLVREFASVSEGSVVADLYAGAGLLSVPLSQAVGENVWVVEGGMKAVRDARRNLPKELHSRIVCGDVGEVLASDALPSALDAVVLDPPRAGAGKAVVEQVVARRPEAAVYVACDPAALARDVSYFGDAGYRLAHLEAWDFFPHTHHVESIAVFSPDV